MERALGVSTTRRVSRAWPSAARTLGFAHAESARTGRSWKRAAGSARVPTAHGRIAASSAARFDFDEAMKRLKRK